MKDIDKSDAPEGFYAVAAEENIFGVITCHGCVFMLVVCLMRAYNAGRTTGLTNKK